MLKSRNGHGFDVGVAANLVVEGKKSLQTHYDWNSVRFFGMAFPCRFERRTVRDWLRL